MESVQGTSSQQVEYVSLEDIVKLLYFYGLTSISIWFNTLQQIKNDVYKSENVHLFEMYIKLVDITKKMKTGLELKLANSQSDLLLLDEYLFDIDDIYDYLFENIINFSNKNIPKSSYLSIFNFIKQVKPTSSNEDEVDGSDTMDLCSSNESEEDEFNKLFSSLKDVTEPKKKNIFQQTLMFQSNGTRKMLTTPGEKGRYLMKIEITDTRDLRGVPKNDWWQKAAYRTQFLVDSDKNPIYTQLHKIVLNKAKDFTKIKNLKKTKFSKQFS